MNKREGVSIDQALDQAEKALDEFEATGKDPLAGLLALCDALGVPRIEEMFKEK